MIGWALALLAGGVWGFTFFSWGLPLPMPFRIVATLMLVVALGTASTAGRLAAGGFALGMGLSSALLLASSGLLFDAWASVPVVALLGAVFLHLAALLRPPAAR